MRCSNNSHSLTLNVVDRLTLIRPTGPQGVVFCHISHVLYFEHNFVNQLDDNDLTALLAVLVQDF